MSVISSVVRLCLFFFFKQKTAYEMRISDWSSDVCSSDLSSAQLLCDITRALVGVVLPLPLCNHQRRQRIADDVECGACHVEDAVDAGDEREDRKSTRLNSSH